jgi:hypothetical protein
VTVPIGKQIHAWERAVLARAQETTCREAWIALQAADREERRGCPRGVRRDTRKDRTMTRWTSEDWRFTRFMALVALTALALELVHW